MNKQNFLNVAMTCSIMGIAATSAVKATEREDGMRFHTASANIGCSYYVNLRLMNGCFVS